MYQQIKMLINLRIHELQIAAESSSAASKTTERSTATDNLAQDTTTINVEDNSAATENSEIDSF
jgi:hypothetical protein